MQRMTWVNGAQKRIKLKSDKKKASTGEAQRQFFSSERHARLMQAAPPAGNAQHQHKSLDMQSLSTRPLAGGHETTSPVFVSPRPNAGEDVRAMDASFDKPTRTARPPAVFSPVAAAAAESPVRDAALPVLAGEKIRFYDQGRDVTDDVYKRFASDGLFA
jgi:hypothetical protein